MPALAVMTLLQDRRERERDCSGPLAVWLEQPAQGQIQRRSRPQERDPARRIPADQVGIDGGVVRQGWTSKPSSRPIARAVVRMVSAPCTTPLAGRRAPETCTTDAGAGRGQVREVVGECREG